jgi:hypothetical protein
MMAAFEVARWPFLPETPQPLWWSLSLAAQAESAGSEASLARRKVVSLRRDAFTLLKHELRWRVPTWRAAPNSPPRAPWLGLGNVRLEAPDHAAPPESRVSVSADSLHQLASSTRLHAITSPAFTAFNRRVAGPPVMAESAYCCGTLWHRIRGARCECGWNAARPPRIRTMPPRGP